VDDIRLIDGEDDTATDPLPTLPRIPRIVSRVTTWSDGTVHIERPGEPTQVVTPLEGA
jgi:hypothetical protein